MATLLAYLLLLNFSSEHFWWFYVMPVLLDLVIIGRIQK